MLTTGMPAASAFCATGVSASPSCGRTTRASGFFAIACSICCACESASAASSSSNLTSLCCSAAFLAFFEIAPSQPWSVGGTLAMIVTFLPVPPVAGVAAAGACSVTVFVPPPQAATPIASRHAAATDVESRFSDMDLPPGCGCLSWRLCSSVARLRALEQDGSEDDRALGHLLDLRGQVELRHQAEDER